MKWIYLIMAIICYAMLICGYEVEKSALLSFICSIAFVCLNKIDELKENNNLK